LCATAFEQGAPITRSQKKERHEVNALLVDDDDDDDDDDDAAAFLGQQTIYPKTDGAIAFSLS